jgi:hypothetical protein
MDRDVADLIENRKIPVYVVEEDLAERGIASDELVSGVKLVSRRALPGLFCRVRDRLALVAGVGIIVFADKDDEAVNSSW